MESPTIARHGASFAANCLGWELLARKEFQGSSIIISPASIALCLALLGGGAEGQARETIFSKLGAPNADGMRSESANLLKAFEDESDATITGGNAVYFDRTCEVNPKFEEHVRAFQAVVNREYERLPDAVDEINGWVSEQTHGMITKLVGREMLENPLAHIVLLNALSFKGFWETPFNQSNTVEGYSFWNSSGSSTAVPMMFLKKEHVLAAEGPGYTVACLPYKQASPSAPSTWFMGYLPNEDQSANDILPKLRTGHAPLTSSKYDNFGLPRFEIEKSLSLLPVLRDLGYLSTNSFPEMAKGSNVVSSIIHKTKIEVDEQGTRAAAATTIMMTRAMFVEERNLIFNRPFVFSIVDERGLALFTGVFSPEGC